MLSASFQSETGNVKHGLLRPHRNSATLCPWRLCQSPVKAGIEIYLPHRADCLMAILRTVSPDSHSFRKACIKDIDKKYSLLHISLSYGETDQMN